MSDSLREQYIRKVRYFTAQAIVASPAMAEEYTIWAALAEEKARKLGASDGDIAQAKAIFGAVTA